MSNLSISLTRHDTTARHPHGSAPLVGIFKDSKITRQPAAAFTDAIYWNLPEQKTGIVQIIAGNAQSFNLAIRSTETFTQLPIKEARLLLPDALRSKLPPLPTVNFSASTDSGSFAKSPTLNHAVQSADITLFAGDLSKNSATATAVAEAIQPSTHPFVIARDTVDLLAPEMTSLIEKPQFTLIASLAQLQKVLRAIYYPKMLLLSMPLLPVLETLHKFTLSYPCVVLTFHQEQIILAHDGQVWVIPLTDTTYTPLTLWAGTLACHVTAFQLWNPSHALAATLAALLWQKPTQPTAIF